VTKNPSTGIYEVAYSISTGFFSMAVTPGFEGYFYVVSNPTFSLHADESSSVSLGEKHPSHEMIRLAYSGESVSSLRTLLKRAEFWSKDKSALSGTGLVFPSYRAQPYPSIFEWIVNGYLGYRGGYRHKFIMSTTTSASVLFTHDSESTMTTSEEVVLLNNAASLTLDFPYYSIRKYKTRFVVPNDSSWYWVSSFPIDVSVYISAAEDFNCLYYFGGPLIERS